jgi:hypothetical protein
MSNNKLEQCILSGEPFTYGGLCALTENNDAAREADKLIQKWRRKGWIAFTREGRSVVWRLTKEGKKLQTADV